MYRSISVHFLMKRIIVAFALFFIFLPSMSQVMTEIVVPRCNTPYKQRAKLHIQQVTLQDTFLVQQLERLIRDESKESEYFRSGMGYLEVFPTQILEQGIEHRYYIKNDFISFREDKNDSAFPAFYSWVGGRLVFIHLQMLDGVFCYRYSKRSKKELKKKLEPFLPKSEKLVARDSTGKVFIRDKHFRLEQTKLHGGRYVYVFNDGRPPVVTPELPGFLLNPDVKENQLPPEE